MSGDISLGKILGIPFRLHWSWFLAVILIAWTLTREFLPAAFAGYDVGQGFYWTLGIVAALGLFVSILLHELGHAVVAKAFGVPVLGIRLFIFGGVAELGSEARKPSHEVLIAIGGPVVTVILIGLYFSAMALIGALSGIGSGQFPLGAQAATIVLLYLGLINLMVLVFNMIPAFPLDGGRVFRGIIWAITGKYLTSTRIAATVGIGFSWVLFALAIGMALTGNLAGGVWFFFLSTFLHNAAQSSIAYAQLQHLLRGVGVRQVMRPNPIAVDASLSLREAVEDYFLRHPYKAYPVVDDGRFVGILTLRAVQEVDRDRWDLVRVEELVSHEPSPAVQPNEPVLQALSKMAGTGRSRLPVVENGALVGLLCYRDVMDWMNIRAGLTAPAEEFPLHEGGVPVESSRGR